MQAHLNVLMQMPRVTQVRCSETMNILKRLHQENRLRQLLRKPSPNTQLARGLSVNASLWDFQKAVPRCNSLPISFSPSSSPKLRLQSAKIVHECLIHPVLQGSRLPPSHRAHRSVYYAFTRVMAIASHSAQTLCSAYAALPGVVNPGAYPNSQSSCLIFHCRITNILTVIY